jgi:hypothetical protein
VTSYVLVLSFFSGVSADWRRLLEPLPGVRPIPRMPGVGRFQRCGLGRGSRPAPSLKYGQEPLRVSPFPAILLGLLSSSEKFSGPAALLFGWIADRYVAVSPVHYEAEGCASKTSSAEELTMLDPPLLCPQSGGGVNKINSKRYPVLMWKPIHCFHQEISPSPASRINAQDWPHPPVFRMVTPAPPPRGTHGGFELNQLPGVHDGVRKQFTEPEKYGWQRPTTDSMANHPTRRMWA